MATIFHNGAQGVYTVIAQMEGEMFRDDFTEDIVFDPEDVDLFDLIELSVGIHGEMCPEICPIELPPIKERANNV